MQIYRFKPSGRTDQRVALTSDQTGKALPPDGAPWQLIGDVDLAASKAWINAPAADIEAAIAKSGYFIWSIMAPPLKTRFGK